MSEIKDKYQDTTIFDIFKEKTSDGIIKYSFTRVSSFMLILFYMSTSLYSLIKFGKFPDLPDNYMYLILGAYGINKLRDRILIKNKEQK